jgi:hypothetical protein
LFIVPIWVERFALAVLATVFVGVVILNALKMDWIQRTGLGIGILGFSIYLAQSLHLFNESKKTPSGTPGGGSVTVPPTVAEKGKPKSEPPIKVVRPIKAPLEIVAFNSTNGISIANNGPLPVYVISLLVEANEPQAGASYGLGFDVEPGKVGKYPLKEGFDRVRSLNLLADTWEEHLRRATEIYRTCGIQLTYLSPSDPGFQTMKNMQAKNPRGLAYNDASGVLLYRVHGFSETKKQQVPIIVTATVNDATCPRYY